MARGERGTSKPFLRGDVWWIRYKAPGELKERRESTGSTDKQVAKRLIRTRLREIDERKIVASTDATIDDLLKLYLDDQRPQGRHSIKQAEGYVRLHLSPAFGSIKTARLKSRHIEAFVHQKQAQNYANATINRWLEALRHEYALSSRALPPLVYVAPNIKDFLLEENNVREGFLEHDQYVILRDELPDHQKLLLVLGYHYGMRRGEILSLRWDQIDWDGNVIRLEKRQTKGKKARVAPLYGELRAWLALASSVRDHECEFIVS